MIKILLACALLGCSPTSPATPPNAQTTIDVSAYTAEQLACIEREPNDECHRDKVACRKRIDDCRNDVKKRWGR